jgi:outer membrane protein TolC
LVQEASANIGREDLNLTATQRAVRTAAEQAYETVATTRAQVHQFESSILDDTESALRTGIDAYRTGQVDALNLIDIYRTYIDSRTEYSRSLYQYLSALARLDAAGDIAP